MQHTRVLTVLVISAQILGIQATFFSWKKIGSSFQRSAGITQYFGPPLYWSNLYTAWPQPINTSTYLDEPLFRCRSDFALCAFSACVPIPGSVPPMSECGCYAFKNQPSSGASEGILKESVRVSTPAVCENTDCNINVNVAPFCKEMIDGSFFPGFDYVSTFNPDLWQEATGEPGPGQVDCTEGGTFTICYSAACLRGQPSSPYLPDGAPPFNATCYCPIYNAAAGESFNVASNAPDACGPKSLSDLTPSTVLYNGA